MSFSYDAYGKFYKFKFSIDIVVIVIYLLVESFTYFIRYVTVNSCYHSSQVFWVLYKNCSCSYDMLRDGPSSECSLCWSYSLLSVRSLCACSTFILLIFFCSYIPLHIHTSRMSKHTYVPHHTYPHLTNTTNSFRRLRRDRKSVV